ncbi:phage scaffolding protein, partial [Streptococcus pneumoniae]
MNLEQLTALGLSEDVAKKVLESHKEAVKDFIPKERFDEVNNEKKRLEGVVTERDKQIVELGKVDAEGLQSKITELTEANKLAEKNHAEQLTAQAKEFKM